MDVVLEPGDALYVPRGCFHRTATPNMDGTPSKISAGDDDENAPILGEKSLQNLYDDDDDDQKKEKEKKKKKKKKENDDDDDIMEGQKERDMLTNDEIIAQTSIHLTTHMAKLHDFGGLEQIMTTAMGSNKNALFENRWSDAIDQLLTKNIQYRTGLHFRQNWKQKWRTLMHGVVDEMMDNTNYLDTMHRNFEESRIRRTRKMFERHGWNGKEIFFFF